MAVASCSGDVFRPCLCIADDLSGAAETAVALGGAPAYSRIELRSSHSHAALLAYNAQYRVIDLDLREVSGQHAHDAVRRTFETVATGSAYVKIDSLLRGNVAEIVDAAASTGPVVIAPALPGAGRTTVGARLRMSADAMTPDAGDDEGGSLPDRLRLHNPVLVDLRTVRGTRAALECVLADAARAGRTALCDAETDADLDAVVAASSRISNLRLVGAAGLAAAIGRTRTASGEHCTEAVPPARGPGTLVVVGTAETSARRQVDRLVERGVPHVSIGPSRTSRDSELLVSRITPVIDHGSLVLTIDESARSAAVPAAATAAFHAHVVAEAVRELPSTRLFVTGGHTARSVLDALGVGVLTPVRRVDHGAVHSRTESGRDIVTRPGSFGDDDAIVRAVEYLRAETEGIT